MVQIRTTGQLTVPQNVSVLIYGQSGAGKTTLALSCERPLVLDFDNGLQRVRASHTRGAGMVQVQRWEDVLEVLNMDTSAYKTVVVDTLGKLTDTVTRYMCADRQPRLNDWGRINGEIKAFTQRVRASGKDVVFVAQREETKRGEDTFFRPAFRAKNYNELITDLDMVGYLDMRAERGVQIRRLTFDPTSENDGKNTCSLPSSITVPLAGEEFTFMADRVITPCKARNAELARSGEEYARELAEIETAVAQITDAQGANAFVAAMRGRRYQDDTRLRALRMLEKRATELGLDYDKKSKRYE